MLSLPQMVAQMVVVRASGHLFDGQIRYPQWEPPLATLRHWIESLGVGGVILLGGGAAELALRSQQLQDWAALPLLVAADVEEGVGQRFAGATWFPPPMALAEIAHTQPERALEYGTRMGRAIAAEALAIGLNWILAPVVDVNNNPANPVINVRAFGETPKIVSQLTTAFIRGAQDYPVLTAAKHFPGHGDTAVDSHLDLPVLLHSPVRLQSVELPPFRAAIAAGVDAVMSAHLLMPTWDEEYPATLSQRILTTELRQNLGFDGLIVTDALIMGAIAHRYGTNQAAVLAVAAGADILLMPADPQGAIAAVVAAVEEGTIPLERIQASVERIWRAKQKVGATLIRQTTAHDWDAPKPRVDGTCLTTHLAQSQAVTLTESMLRESQRVHLPNPEKLIAALPCRNLILVDDLLDCEFLGSQAPAIALPRQQSYALELSAASLSVPAPSDLPTLLQLFIRGNPFRGSAGLTHTAEDCLRSLIQAGTLQAVILYGSPYLLDHFLPLLPPDIPWVFTYGQMPQAQAIALETLFNPAPPAPPLASTDP